MINNLRFKYCFSIKKGKVPLVLSEDYFEDSLPYLSLEFIRNGTYDAFCKGGIVIPKDSMLLLWDGANAGEILQAPEKGVLASTCALITPNEKINKKMAKWYLTYCEEKLRSLTTGMGIPHVDSEILNNIVIPIYSNEIQLEKSNYLDKYIGIIDSSLEKEEKLLCKLNEMKISSIYKYVFNGFNNEKKKINNCSLSITSLPESWSKNKLSRITTSKSGSTPSRSNSIYWDNGNVNWMASGEVNKEEVFDTDEKISKIGFRSNSLKMFPVNTIMLALNGQGKTKGMTAILKNPSTCNQSLLGIICNNKIYYKYLYYYFKAVYKDLRLQVGDEEREGLSGDYIKSLIIPVPPITVQEKIANILDRKCLLLNKLIESKSKKIKLLKEYRKSLINEIILGRR